MQAGVRGGAGLPPGGTWPPDAPRGQSRRSRRSRRVRSPRTDTCTCRPRRCRRSSSPPGTADQSTARRAGQRDDAGRLDRLRDGARGHATARAPRTAGSPRRTWSKWMRRTWTAPPRSSRSSWHWRGKSGGWRCCRRGTGRSARSIGGLRILPPPVRVLPAPEDGQEELVPLLVPPQELQPGHDLRARVVARIVAGVGPVAGDPRHVVRVGLEEAGEAQGLLWVRRVRRP